MQRLFLSVDMMGSTQFKARYTGLAGEGWLETFRTFFTNFPLMLAGQIGIEFIDRDESPAVDVWKVMGDEIIFVAEAPRADGLVSILRVLLRAMNLYEDRYLQRLPLRLKGTAWLAAFGERNIELDIPELSSSETSPHLDFIGPDIDLGFRLAKFARPSCLVLSLNLVEAMLDAGDADTVALYLIGREELQGVMFGRPYPIVWMHDADGAFDFLPWEIAACRLVAAAVAARRATPEELRREIGEIRLYLRKMHGVDLPPAALPQ